MDDVCTINGAPISLRAHIVETLQEHERAGAHAAGIVPARRVA